ncbi:Hypothetical predicted protein [Pelobates cultripes]|uniref:Uncharacterized protein n=1 Tax=Pelobates cultripes TaxID=61616 RepID=A0AAD1S448_PELCU|nr:Hypothetical predicted protein [Pelobates cultripes]
MEDRSRCTNVKILGISDIIGPTELPQYLERLTAVLLLQVQAKKLEFNSHFRINKDKQAPPAASRDVIVQCHSMSDKRSILPAVSSKTPLDFES